MNYRKVLWFGLERQNNRKGNLLVKRFRETIITKTSTKERTGFVSVVGS